MEKKIEVYENTEVQELIGYIPSSLQKWGIYLIALFILVLFSQPLKSSHIRARKIL